MVGSQRRFAGKLMRLLSVASASMFLLLFSANGAQAFIGLGAESYPDFIEPGDQLEEWIDYYNFYKVEQKDIELIDVLPFNGDGSKHGNTPGRNPASSYHGEIKFVKYEPASTLFPAPTARYTDADPASVYTTMSVSGTGYGALPAGKKWCTLAEINFGVAGCPASVVDTTAIRLRTIETLYPNWSRGLIVTIETEGSRSGDVYANTHSSYVPANGDNRVISAAGRTDVVANRIGSIVWGDENGNGRYDSGESGISGVTVTLDGVDKHGRIINITTTTDTDGKYQFTSSSQAGQDAGVVDLVSGYYSVTFDPGSLPSGAKFTTQNATGASDTEDSDADPITGKTAEIELPDPTLTRQDGEDVTLAAGVLLLKLPPAQPGQPQPQPTSPLTANPVIPEPAADEPEASASRSQASDVEATDPVGSVADNPVLYPRLRLRVSANRKMVRPGQTVRYRLTVRNTGMNVISNASVCDALPDHLTLVGGRAPGARLVGNKLCWKIPSVRPGQSIMRTFLVRVDRTAKRGVIINNVTVAGRGVLGVMAKARNSVRVLRTVSAGRSAGAVTG